MLAGELGLAGDLLGREAGGAEGVERLDGLAAAELGTPQAEEDFGPVVGVVEVGRDLQDATLDLLGRRGGETPGVGPSDGGSGGGGDRRRGGVSRGRRTRFLRGDDEPGAGGQEQGAGDEGGGGLELGEDHGVEHPSGRGGDGGRQGVEGGPAQAEGDGRSDGAVGEGGGKGDGQGRGRARGRGAEPSAGQAASEQGPGPGEADLDGADRAAEPSGDLVVRAAAEVVQDHREAVAGGQAVDLLEQGLVGVPGRLGLGLGPGGEPFPGASPGGVEAGSEGDPAGDPAEPGRGGVPVPDRTRSPGEDEEGGLEGVLGGVGVPEQAEADPPDRRPVAPDEGLEGGLAGGVEVGGEVVQQSGVGPVAHHPQAKQRVQVAPGGDRSMSRHESRSLARPDGWCPLQGAGTRAVCSTSFRDCGGRSGEGGWSVVSPTRRGDRPADRAAARTGACRAGRRASGRGWRRRRPSGRRGLRPRRRWCRCRGRGRPRP
ncbi:hypothetical protein ElP_68350 [Tautonia plasticadhaerens]|uniref:Uncharacterized protein n=1 Tax=Tautonia plasticadhaerens TaxID=2527974 RepID=A0A518HDU9_9BACT|nr:hypothetical protein ElP_68350 [Tautonia plasticadhaerens]